MEYVRQVNKNLDQRLSDQQKAEFAEVEPGQFGRKEVFLRKMKELRHREVLKPNDYRKLGRAALFGAIAGAGAGLLVEHIPQLSEFAKGIRDNLGDLGSITSGVKDIAGNIPGGVGDTLGAAGRTAGDVLGGANQLPGLEGVKGIAGGAKDTIGNIAGGAAQTAGDTIGQASHLPGVEGVGDIAGTVGRTGGDILGTVGGLTDNIPGVKGVKDIAGGALDTAGQTVSGIKQVAGLESAPPTVEAPIPLQANLNAAEANYSIVKDRLDATTDELTQAHQTIDNLQQQLTEANRALETSKEIVPKLDEIQSNLDDMQKQLTETKQALADAKGVIPVAGAAEVAAKAASEQTLTHAQSALDSFGGTVSLQAGSNPWEVSTNILKQMGVEPTPGQIMQLDKVLSSENSISVPDWGIKGTIDAHNLPVGFKLNLTDVVKKTALEIANKK